MTRSGNSKNNGNNEDVDESLKTPPAAPKRGTGRGRGSARGGRSTRGRGRGTASAETSPVLGAAAFDQDIEVEEFLTEAELALDETGLEQAIEAEEKKGRLLEQQRRLAILKKENSKKASELRQINIERPARVVFNEIDNLPRMNESAGRQLPTLGDIEAEVPSISNLRARPDLQLQVDQQLEDLDVSGLQRRPTLQAHHPGATAYTGASGATAGIQTGRLQSGRTAKSDYGVVRLVIWPHTRVFSKIGATISYDKLDLASLIVGELTIISDSATPEAERKARILQLIRVCNYSRSFEWSLVREYHAAYLSAIERSLSGDWFAIDVNDIAAQVLFLVPRHQIVAPVQIQQQGAAPGGGPYRRFDKQAKNSGRYFCSAYNKGVCPHAGSHKAVVAGRLRSVDHICANCLLAFDEIQLHPETECPRAPARRGNQQNGNNINNGDNGNVGH